MRSAVEDVLGTLSGAPHRTTSAAQDMPTLSCDYPADSGWLTVSIMMGQGRAQFERLAALVPDSKRVDGVADVAFSIPSTPQQRPAGATISLWHAGTLVTIEAADAKTAAALGADVVALQLARAITSDDQLLHGRDKPSTDRQHLQGGG